MKHTVRSSKKNLHLINFRIFSLVYRYFQLSWLFLLAYFPCSTFIQGPRSILFAKFSRPYFYFLPYISSWHDHLWSVKKKFHTNKSNIHIITRLQLWIIILRYTKLGWLYFRSIFICYIPLFRFLDNIISISQSGKYGVCW